MSDRQGAYSKKAKRRNDRLGVCHKVTIMCNARMADLEFSKNMQTGNLYDDVEFMNDRLGVCLKMYNV
jgi:hypothetical protein